MAWAKRLIGWFGSVLGKLSKIDALSRGMWMSCEENRILSSSRRDPARRNREGEKKLRRTPTSRTRPNEPENGVSKGSFHSALLATTLVAAGAALAATVFLSAGLLIEKGVRAAQIAGGLYSHDLFYAFVIALTNNVDNLGARIAYSMQGTRVSTLVNLWISLITFTISSAAALSGAMVIGSFGTKIASFIAMALLVALGSWMALQARKQDWHSEKPPEQEAASLWRVLAKPHHADLDHSKHIDLKEATILGIALSINNIGGGLSAGIMGISPFLVGFLSALLSFVALWGGNYVADVFVRGRIANKAALIGGLLLIAIGVKQIF